MSDWLSEAVAVVEQVRTFYPVLDGLHGTPNAPDGETERYAKRTSNILPFDPRPIDLMRDVRRFAIHYSSLAHGTLRAGIDRCRSTVERLSFVAGVLPSLNEADPELTRELVEEAWRCACRYEMIVDPPEPTPGYTLVTPCSECAGELWASTVDYHVQCLACGAVWTFEDIERSALAVSE